MKNPEREAPLRLIQRPTRGGEGLLRPDGESNCGAEGCDCRNLDEGYEDARGSPEVLVAADLVVPAEAVECDEEARDDRANGFQAGYEVGHILQVVALRLDQKWCGRVCAFGGVGDRPQAAAAGIYLARDVAKYSNAFRLAGERETLYRSGYGANSFTCTSRLL